jgi:hypothetical protein
MTMQATHKENIYYREDPQLAFKNALCRKVMTKPEDYMYMYTRLYSDGLYHDVFKHKDTRRLETVLMEGQ